MWRTPLAHVFATGRTRRVGCVTARWEFFCGGCSLCVSGPKGARDLVTRHRFGFDLFLRLLLVLKGRRQVISGVA